MTMETRRL